MSAAPAVILIVVGIVIVLVGAQMKAHVRKQLKWVRVPGTITSSSVHPNADEYRHYIEYTYSYGGVVYRGDRLRSLQITYNWRWPSERSASAYPVGADVDVFVDPEFPRESVLEPGGDPAFIPFFLTFAMIPFGIGAWMLAR
jgi:hypothetical protein